MIVSMVGIVIVIMVRIVVMIGVVIIMVPPHSFSSKWTREESGKHEKDSKNKSQIWCGNRSETLLLD